MLWVLIRSALEQVQQEPTAFFLSTYPFQPCMRWCFTLLKHAYSNILKMFPPKNENFQIKK